MMMTLLPTNSMNHLSEDMSNDTLIYETDDRTDTTYFKTIQNFRYYQITSEDVWGLQSTSNIEVGDYDVELWGEYYSVLNTTSLNLLNSGLTGSIPSEIGNLTNLTYLYLYTNQLSGSIPSEIETLTNLNRLYLYNNQLIGEIPSSIGNLNNLEFLLLDNNQLSGLIPENLCGIIYVNVGGNNLCPPYPECLSEEVVGYQDTSNCEQVSIIDETLPVSYNLYNAYPNPFNPSNNASLRPTRR